MYWTDVIATLAVPDALWQPLAMARSREAAQALYNERIESFHRCYKKKALATHPDRGGNASAFAKAATAWEALEDPAWLDALYAETAKMRQSRLIDTPTVFRAGRDRRWGFTLGNTTSMHNTRGGIFAHFKERL